MEEDSEGINSFEFVVLTELGKLNKRLDTIDDKVTEIHVVNERIKKEANFRRTYSKVPLYGAKHITHTDYNEDSSSSGSDTDEGIIDQNMLRNRPVGKKDNCCSII